MMRRNFGADVNAAALQLHQSLHFGNGAYVAGMQRQAVVQAQFFKRDQHAVPAGHCRTLEVVGQFL